MHESKDRGFGQHYAAIRNGRTLHSFSKCSQIRFHARPIYVAFQSDPKLINGFPPLGPVSGCEATAVHLRKVSTWAANASG